MKTLQRLTVSGAMALCLTGGVIAQTPKDQNNNSPRNRSDLNRTQQQAQWEDPNYLLNQKDSHYTYDYPYYVTEYWHLFQPESQETRDGPDRSQKVTADRSSNPSVTYYYWVPTATGDHRDRGDATRSSNAAGRDARAKRRDSRGQPAPESSWRSGKNDSAEWRPRLHEPTNINRQQRPASSPTLLKGTVEGFREVDLRTDGQGRQQHTFAKIRLRDGESRIVDLGRRVDLQGLDLERGDRLRIEGKTSAQGDRQILVAERIKIGGRTFHVDRNHRCLSLSGTLKDYRSVSIGKERRNHLLVRLALDNGRDIVADFGPNASLEDLSLEKNDRISVKGCRTTVNGKSVLVVQQVSVADAKKNASKSSEDNRNKEEQKQT